MFYLSLELSIKKRYNRYTKDKEESIKGNHYEKYVPRELCRLHYKGIVSEIRWYWHRTDMWNRIRAQ